MVAAICAFAVRPLPVEAGSWLPASWLGEGVGSCQLAPPEVGDGEAILYWTGTCVDGEPVGPGILEKFQENVVVSRLHAIATTGTLELLREEYRTEIWIRGFSGRACISEKLAKLFQRYKQQLFENREISSIGQFIDGCGFFRMVNAKFSGEILEEAVKTQSEMVISWSGEGVPCGQAQARCTITTYTSVFAPAEIVDKDGGKMRVFFEFRTRPLFASDLAER
jgi:hypothetical protein